MGWGGFTLIELLPRPYPEITFLGPAAQPDWRWMT